MFQRIRTWWVGKDDRGRDLPRAMMSSWDPLRELDKRTRARVHQRVQSAMAVHKRAVICACLILTMFPILSWMDYLYVLPRGIVGAIGCVVLGATVAFIALWMPRVRVAMRKALVLEHRCAWCGHDLAGCRADEDGCTVCPECGAAWRLSASAGGGA